MSSLTRPRPLVIDSHRDAKTCLHCQARAISVCSVIDDGDLERLSMAASTLSVQPGHNFIEEGDPAEHFFNVTSGTAKLYKLLPDGRRLLPHLAWARILFRRFRLDQFPEGCVLFGFAVARNAREGY